MVHLINMIFFFQREKKQDKKKQNFDASCLHYQPFQRKAISIPVPSHSNKGSDLPYFFCL